MIRTLQLQVSSDLLICNACGTQYPVTNASKKDSCRICDDPRQFVPPEGQSFTTLRSLTAREFHNTVTQDEQDPNIWFIRTEPQFAIGQRAILLRTPTGNVLWDLVAYLDKPTVSRIQELGGIDAIVISHPHYYTTYADWARTFDCPVYVGGPDREWLLRADTPGVDVRYITGAVESILAGSGVTTILAGGHFPGSLLLHWKTSLFLADTIVAVPSAFNPVPGKQGVISFTFFWSIPNRIPLGPDDVVRIWSMVQYYDFDTAFGAFEGMNIRTQNNEKIRQTGGVKGRLLESCKIYIRAMGYKSHDILDASLQGTVLKVQAGISVDE